jgi:hypothetical protein
MAGIQRVKYQTDADSIFNVLLDQNTGIDTLIGTVPTGAYTENMTIRVSKNNKEVGIRPRQVLLTRNIGGTTADANCLVQTADRYKRVPIPTKARWDTIALQSKFTIGGTEYTVRKKIQELVV